MIGIEIKEQNYNCKKKKYKEPRRIQKFLEKNKQEQRHEWLLSTIGTI